MGVVMSRTIDATGTPMASFFCPEVDTAAGARVEDNDRGHPNKLFGYSILHPTSSLFLDAPTVDAVLG
jgi:hypothetical protein